MLPLLLFRTAWTSIWLLRIALPLWSTHRFDAATTETAFECAMAAIFSILIPWSYAWHQYVMAPADPWRDRFS